MGVMSGFWPPPPPPPGQPTAGLPSVVWDGMQLNDERPDGTTLVVTNLEGWYGLPAVTSNDADRALVDGQAAGPKVLGSRDMTLEGYVVGQTRPTRATLARAVDDLVSRANRRDMSILAVSDPWLGVTTQVEMRAVGALEHTWRGPWAWQYSVPLRAYDPRRYETDVEAHQVTLARRSTGTGRVYRVPQITSFTAQVADSTGATATAPLSIGVHQPPGTVAAPNIRGPYPWRYASPDTGHSAMVWNDGNTPAPLLLTYTGDLGESRVTDGTAAAVLLTALDPGVTISVNSESLAAWAPGGYGRPSFVRAGSRPLVIAPGTRTRISLYTPSGSGQVTITWRCAWL